MGRERRRREGAWRSTEGRLHMAPISQRERTLVLPLLRVVLQLPGGGGGSIWLHDGTVHGGEEAPRLSPPLTPYRQR